ncbi:MAG: CPBP family intramembrane glutamic endopeptidase [Acidobacteriota bacterium]|jgi:membrane protease YdiL (CAAX protease family)
MIISKILFDNQSKRLRSGWRVVVYLGLLISPLIVRSMLGSQSDSPGSTPGSFDVGPGMIFNYLLMVIWTLLVSWGCLVVLDREWLDSLGLACRPGWWIQLGRGLGGGLLMVAGVVLIQIIVGGSRPGLNPYWSKGTGVDETALRHALFETGLTLLMMLLAALFEELLYRGYAFQTLLRGVHPLVPLALLSSLFGLSHLGNPNSTFFSTLNTILAGIWLSLAYLEVRNLWLPTGLHLGWNLALGPIFGLPVSGRLIPAHPLLITTSTAPEWITGGAYGSEGGAAATLALLAAIVFILRRRAASTVPAGSDAAGLRSP